MQRILLLALIWGWSFLFIKVGVEGLTPVTVAALRVALGCVVVIAVLRWRRLRMPRDLATWGHFAVMGALASAAPFTLLAWGEQHITSALTSVLNASTPLFAAVFSALLLGERLKASQFVGLGLGFAGVGVAAGVGGADFAESSLGGALAPVGAAACYGLTMVYARRYLNEVPPLVNAAGQLLTATVLLAPPALVTTAMDGADVEPHRVLAMLLLGAIGTGVAYVIYYRALAADGATKTSVVTYLVPVVAVAVGVAFLDEPFELRLLAGAGLTLVGIGLLHERVLRSRRPPIPA